MHQLGNIKFFVIFSIFVLVEETFGLKCYRCSSDATNSKFCNAIVDVSEFTDQQKQWSYVDCGTQAPYGVENAENLIAKCRFLQQVDVNDERQIYTRSCYWEQANEASNSCEIAAQKSQQEFAKVVRCQTCVEDGCNAKFLDSEENQYNSAIFAVLSNTVFIILVLSAVIGNSNFQMYM